MLRSRSLLCRFRSRRFFATNQLTVDNPYTGQIHVTLPLAGKSEAHKVVQDSSKIQNEWKRTKLAERIELCEKFMVEFEKSADQIASDITNQMGKPLSQAKGEVRGVFERTKAMIKMAPQALEDEILQEKKGFYRKIAKEPVGVVLVIAPWNYPLLTAANAIIPAVLAGNSVIIKHSGRTPLCGNAYQDAFNAAGANGLVRALHCDHNVTEDIINEPQIGFVAFTGSVSGGHQVYQAVAKKRFIDATLELGGKDPAYVAPDADVAAAADCLIDGAFYNAGQSCCGIERVYVHKSLYAQFLEKSLDIVKGYTLGDPMASTTTLGPMAQANTPAFLHQQIKDAVARGGKVLCGGQPTHDSAGKGRFFSPTLVADCNHTMSLMMEESFGPVLGVMPVDDDDQAVKMMNDSPYGLTACIFTSDNDRAHRLAPLIETGTVFRNRCDYLDPELPWTGVKDTGKGISLSVHGFRGVTKLKGYHFKL